MKTQTDADERSRQTDAWCDEHEALRRWYRNETAKLRRKLGRIRDGELVYLTKMKT